MHSYCCSRENETTCDNTRCPPRPEFNVYIYTFGSAYEKFGFWTRPNTRLVLSQIFWKCHTFPAFKNQSRPCLNAICKPIKHVEIGQKHQVTENIRTRQIKKKFMQFNISPPLFLLAFLCLVPSGSRSLKAGTEGVMGRGKKAIIVVGWAKNSCPNYILEPSHHTPLPSYWSDPEIP